MITTIGMKEKFELYRKWLSTLLNKEFMNLPYKEQDKFLSMIKGFLDNCERVHKEARLIKEKTVEIKVKSIEPNNSGYTVIGTSGDLPDLRINYLSSNPLPAVGSSLRCIIFSMDDDLWYSSKEELITGR